jgi:hypothetical protein
MHPLRRLPLMEFALESEEDGKRVRIDPVKPLILKVKRGDQPGGEIAVGMKDGRPFLDNRSSAQCLVNDIDRAAALLAAGDHLQLGALRFRVVATAGQLDVVEPSAHAAPAASSTDRPQRRISASRLAAVEPQTQSSGLLKRVSAAFSGRAEKQRLDELEGERRSALIEAGRRSLADGTALGLPPDTLARLQRGQSVTLQPGDLIGFTRWREDRQRLVRLDAEIAALRQALGLGPDPDAVVLVTPTLKSDERAKVERAYATMDAVGTQPMDSGSEPDLRLLKRSPRPR